MTVNTGMNSTGKTAKGLLCAFLFVLLSAFLLAGVCAAETQEISIEFVSDDEVRSISIDYDEEGYFSSNASEYNLSLAQASLAMAAAAFAPESEYYAETDEDAEEYRCQYLKSAYEKLNFSEMRFYNYDKSLNSTDDRVAYGIANKTISVNNTDWTLFAVQVRGAGYAGEWTSNLHIDPYEIRGTKYSIGFGKPAEEIYNTLNQRLSSIPADTDGKKKVKIWISGFSRAAAVSNVLAGELTKHADELGLNTSSIYAYTFATPNAVLINPQGDVETGYENIHNTLNPCDIVPVVPMSVSNFGWNYSKYGITDYYNYEGFTPDERSKISNKYNEIINDPWLDSYKPISDSGTLPIVFEHCLGETITPEEYISGFYPYVGEMISLAFCGDEADMARLLELNENLDLLHPNDPKLTDAKERTNECSEKNEYLKDEVSFYLITRVVEIIQLFLDDANNANSNNNGPLQEFVDGTVTIGFYQGLEWDDSKKFLNTTGKLADTLIAAISALKKSGYEIENVLTITAEHHPEVYMSVLFSGIGKDRLFAPLNPLDNLHAIIFETKGGKMADGKYIEVRFTSESLFDVSAKKPTKDGYTFEGWVNENNESVESVDISKPGYTYLTAVWEILTSECTVENNTAVFGNENKTILKDSSNAFVDSVLLENVSRVENDTIVEFIAGNSTVNIPDVNGCSRIEITVFEINASVNETLTPAQFTMTVTFENEAAAKDNMDKVRFWHYNTTTGWGTAPLNIKEKMLSDRNVTYTIETDSFSPFGIGIYTPIPQPQPEPSHSSSRDYGASVWLTATPTPTPTPTPAAEPTLVQPSAQPIPTKQPATPVPFAGVIAGLSAAAVLFGLKRR